MVCGVSTCRPRQNLLGVIHCFVNSLFLRPRLQLQRVHKHGVFVKELRTRTLNACISGFRGDISYIPYVRLFSNYTGVSRQAYPHYSTRNVGLKLQARNTFDPIMLLYRLLNLTCSLMQQLLHNHCTL